MDNFSLNNHCWVPGSRAKPKPFLKTPDNNLLKKKMAHGNINLEKNTTNVTCVPAIKVGLKYECKD